jgi:hypothetical protein
MIIHDCEQGSDVWHSLRAGIPTASEFSNLVTSTGEPSKSLSDYALRLAANKYAGKVINGFAGNVYTERGKLLEDEANADYEMTHQVAVQKVGFITNDLMQYGCSPDGLVGDNGGVEYKCKIAKEHIKALLYYQKTGKTPTDYVAQPQGCLFITGREWWDLVFYHPDLPGLTIRQYPDKDFFKVLEKQLKLVEQERNEILNKLKEM